MNQPIRITRGENPYAREVQGKANEPITVAALLDRARARLSAAGEYTGGLDDVSLEAIYDRLHQNAPRVAIIGGSPDHPAHIVDLDTIAFAAARIWEKGGVPFSFSVPVLCDGTAQSNIGMCYSLASRNITAAAVANQMEAHSYHGAFVIQGCDKQPLAIVAALAMLDVVRRRRSDAPVFASFAPAHVLKGGVIPDDLRLELDRVAHIAEDSGHEEIADDLRDTLRYILQCSSNTAFQGVLKRGFEMGIVTADQWGYFEKRLAVNTCDAKGGICAFNGTGNSSRHVVAALGLVHPAVELLTDPATPAAINGSVDAMLGYSDDPAYSVSEMVRQNIEMAVRIHSATGGSTNIMMHLVAVALAAGLDFDIWEYERIHRAIPVPDIFNYSLTEGRDIFALARQCCEGQIRGMETAVFELNRLGVLMPLEAPTAAGKTWQERLSDPVGLPASGVKENQIILSTPRRAVSGIDVLRGNWFESAVVKISGMPESQVDEFDRHVAAVLYFEDEEHANDELLDVGFLERVCERGVIERRMLLAMHRHNIDTERRSSGDGADRITERTLDGPRDDLEYSVLFRRMVAERSLRLAVVIGGQGPEAFGMPEMFAPMQHINANRVLRKLTVLLSDGRYSGVTYGAAIGHITPEAMRGGAIIGLQDGDLLDLRLRERRIDLVDPGEFTMGRVAALSEGSVQALLEGRRDTIADRMSRLVKRTRRIVPINRLVGVTDASRGVVPIEMLTLLE